MTHSRSTSLHPAPSRRPPPAHAAAPAPRPDPEGLVDRRRLADALGCPGACLHESCRRRGRCRGPRAQTAAFPGAVLPACLADGFDELYGPVARWAALMEAIAAAEAKLAALETRPRGASPSRERPAPRAP